MLKRIWNIPKQHKTTSIIPKSFCRIQIAILSTVYFTQFQHKQEPSLLFVYSRGVYVHCCSGKTSETRSCLAEGVLSALGELKWHLLEEQIFLLLFKCFLDMKKKNPPSSASVGVSAALCRSDFGVLLKLIDEIHEGVQFHSTVL